MNNRTWKEKIGGIDSDYPSLRSQRPDWMYVCSPNGAAFFLKTRSYIYLLRVSLYYVKVRAASLRARVDIKQRAYLTL